MEDKKPSKPKITSAFDIVQKEFDRLRDCDKAKVNEAGDIFIHVKSLEEFSSFAKNQGIGVKLIGDLSGDFIHIGLRALVKLDKLGQNYSKAGESFTILSDECETD